MLNARLMNRLRLAGLLIGGISAALVLVAAQRPQLFAQTQGGMWEMSGVPGASGPVRQCVGDVAALARYQHIGRNCAMRVISDSPASAVIDYSCGGAGFGHTKVDMLTPRSLRIDTQGIADRLPFAYVLQARRIGDCPATASAAPH